LNGCNPNLNEFADSVTTVTEYSSLAIITMPKAPTPLYNHASRNATARQLNISTSVSGQSSLSYTSSQVPLDPIASEPHLAHEYYTNDVDMDIDEGDAPEDLNMDEDHTVKVVPGVHAHVVPPKAKRYENSVGHFSSDF
jgi:hypothetical protein